MSNVPPTKPWTIIFYLIVFAMILVIEPASPVIAQTSARIQDFQGKIDVGEIDAYRISDIHQGEALYVYLQTTSGNLDPIAFLIPGDSDIDTIEASYRSELDQLVAAGGDIAVGLKELRDRTFPAWDDDSGQGYSASLSYEIPEDGDLILLVGGALSSLGRATHGEYHLWIGVNSPEVLTGRAQPSGESVAVLERHVLGAEQSVQAISGKLDSQTTTITYRLVDFEPGDVFYARAEKLSGNLAPVLLLRDYGRKPVNAANMEGQSGSASLEYHFPDGGNNYTLEIRDVGGSSETAGGDYQLLLGINVPEVLTGQATSTGSPVIKPAIPVQMGVKLEQIVNVDTQQEFFVAVGSLRMDWSNPNLAFSPDTCNCATKLYTENDFNKFLGDVKGEWPDFTFHNQQGNRWIQNRYVAIRSDGSATYFERFTTNFQLDFDFRQFPFDTQMFYIRVDMLYPVDYYVIEEMPGFSEISPEHGEDEFILQNFQTEVSTIQGSSDATNSRFTFSFEAPRHLSYYFFRIIIPVLLIILISWLTFFLKDYNRRIEVAAGNVLLFIAFSFSLSDNYPRLGYLTFLDAVMAITFIVNTLVIAYNVYMKNLENRGQTERVEKIDRYMDWMYPLFYVGLMLVVVAIFF